MMQLIVQAIAGASVRILLAECRILASQAAGRRERAAYRSQFPRAACPPAPIRGRRAAPGSCGRPLIRAMPMHDS